MVGAALWRIVRLDLDLFAGVKPGESFLGGWVPVPDFEGIFGFIWVFGCGR